MLGIVIPAHNEKDTIAACVSAARAAGRHPGLAGEAAEVVVVLDGCSDATGFLAAQAGAMTVSVRARRVGTARAAGAALMLARGARWLAFTDADTLVAPDWLVDQLSLGADAVCGTVGVDDWSPHGEHADLLHAHFLATYHDHDGHRHVHGANLGISADAYRRAGGFRHLDCSEDVDLVRALQSTGATVAWSAKPRVVTSARKEARASGGFAHALLDAVAQRLGAAALPSPIA